MHPAKRSLNPTLLVLLVLQSPGADAQGYISKEEFFAALTHGYQDAWVKTTETERDTAQPSLQELDPNELVPVSGGWQLTIVHACPLDGSDNYTSNNYGKVMTFTNFAYVLNKSDRMEYLFESQDINAALIDGVDSALDQRRRELAGEFSDVEVALTKQENGKFGLVATFHELLSNLMFNTTYTPGLLGYFTGCWQDDTLVVTTTRIDYPYLHVGSVPNYVPQS